MANERIKLTVENAGGLDRTSWPVTQGIPFADSELERGTPVRILDVDGRSLPCQATCLATWNRDMNYVKWLLLDFLCDLSKGEIRHFFLEYGEDSESPEPTPAAAVDRSGGRIRLDTGALRLDIRQDSPDFLAGCSIRTPDGWRNVLRGQPGPFLYTVSANDEVFDSATAAPLPRITIEDTGPVRASVCIKGYHASSQGIHLCPYTLRIHAWAGCTDLRMHHNLRVRSES